MSVTKFQEWPQSPLSPTSSKLIDLVLVWSEYPSVALSNGSRFSMIMVTQREIYLMDPKHTFLASWTPKLEKFHGEPLTHGLHNGL